MTGDGLGLTDEVGADVEGAPVLVCCADVVQFLGGGALFWWIVSQVMEITEQERRILKSYRSLAEPHRVKVLPMQTQKVAKTRATAAHHMRMKVRETSKSSR